MNNLYKRTLQALTLTVAGLCGTYAQAEPVYVEYGNNTRKEEQTTGMHINGKEFQVSHTEGKTITDKVATKRSIHVGLLEGTLAAYGERTAKTSGVGFDLIGKIGTTATAGLTYENNGEQLVDVRGGVDNTFTAQAGIARQADATLYHAILGFDPIKNMRVSASTVLDDSGKGKINYGTSSIHNVGETKIGWWMFGTQDQHGNGFTDVLIALDPTFGYKAGHFPLTLDDKGMADVSRVDNIADFRAPFNSQRGSTVILVRDNHGSTGSTHTAEIDHVQTIGDVALTLGTALGWKNSDTRDGTLTPNIGAEYDGFNVNVSADLKKETAPEYVAWFWKEWKF